MITFGASGSNDGELSFGNLQFNEFAVQYSLQKIFSTYGVPTDVLIATWSNESFFEASDWLPFSLVVIYKNDGFLIEYILPQREEAQNYLGCISEYYVDLWVWDAKSDMSVINVVSSISGLGINSKNIDYFKPIHEATTLSINDMFNIVSNTSNEFCISTPKDGWE